MSDILYIIAMGILAYACYRLGYQRGYGKGLAEGIRMAPQAEAVRNFWRNFKEALGEAPDSDDTEADS